MRSDRMEVASAALNYAQNLRENPRSAEIKQTLVGILEGNDTNLQLQASSPLWHAFRYPQALDFLLELAKGADKNLRYQALSRLMNNYGHDKPAEPRLVKAVAPLLKDEDDNTRRMAALALSTYDGEEVVRSLIPLLADKYSIIPQELSGRLLEQSDKDMLRRLLTAAANTESSGEVRKAAAAVLEKLSGQ